MNKRIQFAALAAALGVGLVATAGAAHAQQTVNMPIVIELSGAGAVSGTNFRDGAVLAIDEINAKGGILGRKISAPQSDTQSNPGVSRAQVQKAIDSNPYVILGPVFSGSVKVNMILAQQAEVPQFTGGEAADITQMGNPYIFRTSFGAADEHAEDRQLHPRQPEGQDGGGRVGQQRLRQGRPRHLHRRRWRRATSRWWPTSRPSRARSTSPPTS